MCGWGMPPHNGAMVPWCQLLELMCPVSCNQNSVLAGYRFIVQMLGSKVIVTIVVCTAQWYALQMW
jgi:hypothetical protein